MDAVLSAGQSSSTRVPVPASLADLKPEKVIDPPRLGIGVWRIPIEIDPQKPTVAELADDLRRQLDIGVVAVRIEQPGRGTRQWIRLKSPAASAAMIATAYWIASMERSALGSPWTEVQSLERRSAVSLIIVRIVAGSTHRGDAGEPIVHHARMTTHAQASVGVRRRTDCEPPATPRPRRSRTTDAPRRLRSRHPQSAVRIQCRPLPQEVFMLKRVLMILAMGAALVACSPSGSSTSSSTTQSLTPASPAASSEAPSESASPSASPS